MRTSDSGEPTRATSLGTLREQHTAAATLRGSFAWLRTRFSREAKIILAFFSRMA